MGFAKQVAMQATAQRSKAYNAGDQGPVARWLRDNSRLHLQHGPIDLIIDVHGAYQERVLAFQQASNAFNDVLTGLVSDLHVLRQPINNVQSNPVRSSISVNLLQSAIQFKDKFVTPMAGVAGGVATHILTALTHGRALDRAWVNNGGDIALHLTQKQSVTVGVCENPHSVQMRTTTTLNYDSPVRGVATSGWRGRSLSFGIADAVTVLAADAITADIAATLIANEVRFDDVHAAVKQVPACDHVDNSDLGERLVTVAVDSLSASDKSLALMGGKRYAEQLVSAGTIQAAYIALQHSTASAGSACRAPFTKKQRSIALRNTT